MSFHREILFLIILRCSLASAFLLLSARVVFFGDTDYTFLLWNLFLAWIPYISAILFAKYEKKPWYWSVPLFAIWLSFFPNAPYIVTDFVHLPWNFMQYGTFWYDSVMIFAFAFAGLLFGLESLFRVHRSLRSSVGKLLADGTVFSALLLSGVGVYLGRFLRWNSWDAFVNPTEVLRSTVSHYGDPAWFVHALVLSSAFSIFVGISYILFVWLYRKGGK